jgi:hypothetical protein
MRRAVNDRGIQLAFFASPGAGEIPARVDEEDRAVLSGVRGRDELQLPHGLPALRRGIGDDSAPSRLEPRESLREGTARGADGTRGRGNSSGDPVRGAGTNRQGMRPDEVSRSVDYRSLSSARGVRRCRLI